MFCCDSRECNAVTDTAITYYEQRLQKEINDIESRIRDLTQEKLALERQLLKARRHSVSGEVSRKNSLTRVLIETKVLEILKSSTRPVTSTTLFREAQTVDLRLKNSTFRTYLHRMKSKGLIQLAGKSGVWKLPIASAADKARL